MSEEGLTYIPCACVSPDAQTCARRRDMREMNTDEFVDYEPPLRVCECDCHIEMSEDEP